MEPRPAPAARGDRITISCQSDGGPMAAFCRSRPKVSPIGRLEEWRVPALLVVQRPGEHMPATGELVIERIAAVVNDWRFARLSDDARLAIPAPRTSRLSALR